MGERAYIGPNDAEKLRSSDHTPKELEKKRDRGEELTRKEENQLERSKQLKEEIMDEFDSKPENPQIHELRDRQQNPEKYLTKEEREERDRESI